MCSILFRILNSTFNLVVSFGYTFGLTDVTYICLRSMLFESVMTTYYYLPMNVEVAKLIPIHVETSIYAILSGIQAFETLVYGRLVGTLFNFIFDVTLEDTT